MAIAFDASSKLAWSTASTYTWSHTCSGANRILIVGIFGSGAVSTVKYNGVSMTLAKSHSFFGIVYLYYLLAPATGTNTIEVVMTTSALRPMHASSYTGVSDIGATAGGGEQDGDDSITTSITLQATNSYTVEIQESGHATGADDINEGSGQTKLEQDRDDNDGIMAIGYKAQGATGATTLNYTYSGGGNEAQRTAIVELKEGSQSSGTARPISNLLLMGV